jgi:hypothetical protein
VSRPTKPIDLDQLEKPAIFHCTDEEIASFFGITVRTLHRREQKPAFAAVLENGRNKGKIALRRLQWIPCIRRSRLELLLHYPADEPNDQTNHNNGSKQS